MDIEQYFAEVDKAAAYCSENYISNQDFVEELAKSASEKLCEIVECRKELLSPQDYERLRGYLEIGFFTQYSSADRIAIFSFMFEIGSSLLRKNLRKRFQPYEKTQPIFVLDPTLWECIRIKENNKKDLELLDVSKLKNVSDSEVFERNGFYYQLEPLLNPSIYSWVNNTFPDSPKYLRLSPEHSFSSCPLFALNEAVLIPANPNWWKNLSLYNGTKTGSSYFLEDCEVSASTRDQFWEYRIRGIRRLDIIAKRNSSGNLSMMAEELSVKEQDSGVVIGKCIHLDTDDPVGTDFNNSILSHLDLSINVYLNSAGKGRFNANLAKGQKVQDASFRTHLLRVENVPFKSLIAFAVVECHNK